MSENVNEEIPMYCCLPFSYAVKYGLIKIDYYRSTIEIPIKSSLSDNENKELTDKLYKEKYSCIDRDYLCPIHCPFCGLHLNIAIDFEKCNKIGQYRQQRELGKIDFAKLAKLFGIECCRRP